MKKICFIILITFIFGDSFVYKYGSTTTTLESEVFYLNTSDFEAGSELYFQINANNGDVNSDLLYEFSNTEPTTSHSFINYNYLSPYSRGQSSTTINVEISKFTYKYYYEVKSEK